MSAQMPEKDPLNYSIATYVFVLSLSFWAGWAAFIQKVRQDQIQRSLREFIGELVISAFAGIMAFFLCESRSVDPMLSAALIGISAHLGSNFIIQAEQAFMKWLGRVASGDKK